jgi:hypothetical protein
MLNAFGGPNTMICVAVLYAVAAGVWFSIAGNNRMRAVAALCGLVLTGLLIGNLRQPLIDVHYAKGAKLPTEFFSRWNGISRIAVTPEPGSNRLSIVIDGDAATGIPEFEFDKLSEQDKKDLLNQGPGLPYQLRPAAKTLIIGPGGGWDVSRALASGSKDITGVEINPIIVKDVMRGRFADRSKRIYFRPELRIEIEDGRSFVRRSPEKYQVLQATLVDTWASTAAGAFSLSENNLYTSDAFYDYLSHLTDDGMLTFTRWGFEPPRESLRLLSLAIVALEKLGEKDFARHVIIGREGSRQDLLGWGSRDTVLISRRPFSDADVSRAKEAMGLARMELIYAPGDGAKNPFGQLLTTNDRQSFANNYQWDISPVDDDQPFFFYTVQPRDLMNFLSSAVQENADYKINRAVPLLFGLLGISLVATVVTLLLPPLLLGHRLPSEPGVRTFLLYFVCLGAGYILIQISLIQKMVLFLGHPTYALTVIVFSMLLASGLGSYFSEQWLGRARKPHMLYVAVFLLAMALGKVAPMVSKAGAAWPLGVKMLICMLMVGPLAFLMGMPFPNGLRVLERWHKPSVRWAWSLNAASSVLGSAAAIFCAVYVGLYNTLLLGGMLYLVALWLMKRARPLSRVA